MPEETKTLIQQLHVRAEGSGVTVEEALRIYEEALRVLCPPFCSLRYKSAHGLLIHAEEVGNALLVHRACKILLEFHEKFARTFGHTLGVESGGLANQACAVASSTRIIQGSKTPDAKQLKCLATLQL